MKIYVKQAWLEGSDQLDGPFLIETGGNTITGITKVNAQNRSRFQADMETDLTALPGYIDAHEHIGIDVGDERAQAFLPDGQVLLKGAKNLRTMVESGITTMRDCGEKVAWESYWIDALADGTLIGPKVYRSITPIVRTGGHAWYISDQVDGIDAIRAAVRRQVRGGAHWIKVMATGGMGTVGSDPTAPEFVFEELHALAAEAHRLGRTVGAHAHGGEGIDHCLDAGIDVIEHGIFATPSQLQRMVDNGTILVATMGVGLAFESEPNVPAAVQKKMAGTWEIYKETLRNARDKGVTVAVGTDCVHGRLDQEMQLLVEVGYSPLEALIAGTVSGAKTVRDNSVGRLAVGAKADIIFVDGNPLEDPNALSNVKGVLLEGKWAKELNY
jgi:imidazolonepropionase-like amidohydrolase